MFEGFKIADLTCGSGTLLSASYDALLHLYIRGLLKSDGNANIEVFT